MNDFPSAPTLSQGTSDLGPPERDGDAGEDPGGVDLLTASACSLAARSRPRMTTWSKTATTATIVTTIATNRAIATRTTRRSSRDVTQWVSFTKRW